MTSADPEGPDHLRDHLQTGGDRDAPDRPAEDPFQISSIGHLDAKPAEPSADEDQSYDPETDGLAARLPTTNAPESSVYPIRPIEMAPRAAGMSP